MKWRKKTNQQDPTRRVLRSREVSDRSYAYYNSQRHEPNSKPLEVSEEHHSRLRLLPSLIAVLVIVGSILYSLTLSSAPNIELVDSQVSAYRPMQEYQAYASGLISGSLMQQTKLTVNSGEIESKMLDHFPELNGAAMRLPVLGRKPTMTLSIRTPELLISNLTNLFVLDHNGRVVALAKDVEPETLTGLKTVKDESGIELNLGSQAVTSGTVDFIKEIEHQLADKQLEIDTVTLPKSANELHIKLKDTSYFIKMDIAGDARLQSGSYLAVREELARNKITPSQYVDVRVEEKAFYQ